MLKALFLHGGIETFLFLGDRAQIFLHSKHEHVVATVEAGTFLIRHHLDKTAGYFINLPVKLFQLGHEITFLILQFGQLVRKGQHGIIVHRVFPPRIVL